MESKKKKSKHTAFSFFVAFSLLFCSAPKLIGQEKGNLGLDFKASSSASIGFIYHILSGWAVRPAFEFQTSEQKIEFPNSSSDSRVIKSDLYGISVSILKYFRTDNDLAFYAGPAFSYNKTTSQTISNGQEQNRNELEDTRLTGLFGLQYLISKRFSIFGELSIAYIKLDSQNKITGGIILKEISASTSGIGIIFYL